MSRPKTSLVTQKKSLIEPGGNRGLRKRPSGLIMTQSPNPVTVKIVTEIVVTEKLMATLKTIAATNMVTLITTVAMTTETSEATETAEATVTDGTTMIIVATAMTATNASIGTFVTILIFETNGIPKMTTSTVVNSMIAVHTSLKIVMIVAVVKSCDSEYQRRSPSPRLAFAGFQL